MEKKNKIFIILAAIIIFCSGCAAIVVPVPAAKVKVVHPGIYTEILFPVIPIYPSTAYIYYKHGRRHHRHCR